MPPGAAGHLVSGHGDQAAGPAVPVSRDQRPGHVPARAGAVNGTATPGRRDGRPGRFQVRRNIPTQGDAMTFNRTGRTAGPATAPASPPDPVSRRRWLALAVLAVAQFMIFLDETVVN